MSQLNPSEISSVLKEKIAGLDLSAERKNEGIVVSVSDGIVRIHGMGDVMYGEVIEFENGTKGMALNLEQDSVGAVVLGDYLEIIEGQKALCTGKVLGACQAKTTPATRRRAPRRARTRCCRVCRARSSSPWREASAPNAA